MSRRPAHTTDSNECKIASRKEMMMSTPEWRKSATYVLDQIESKVDSFQSVPNRTLKALDHFQHSAKVLYAVIGIYLIASLIMMNDSTTMIRRSTSESYGLIDVPDQEWIRLKLIYGNSERHKYDKEMFIDEPNVWYQYNFPEELSCPNAQRIGGTKGATEEHEIYSFDGYLGDGKWICNPSKIVKIVKNRQKKTTMQRIRQMFGHEYRDKNGCLIYSIGVNGRQLGFETSVQKILTAEASRRKGHKRHRPFCEIHVFDPASYDEQIILDKNSGITYHNWGIVSSATAEPDYLFPGAGDNNPGEFKTFQETVSDLGHDGHVIDIMKVDCKMCEWGIYDDWFDHDHKGDQNEPHDKPGLGMIQQLLVEVHGTPREYVNDFFERMEDENYVIFHKDSETENFKGTSQDYSFVKMSNEFFEI